MCLVVVICKLSSNIFQFFLTLAIGKGNCKKNTSQYCIILQPFMNNNKTVTLQLDQCLIHIRQNSLYNIVSSHNVKL